MCDCKLLEQQCIEETVLFAPISEKFPANTQAVIDGVDTSAFRFKSQKGSMLIYDRIIPSHCRICGRTHDSAGMYLTVCDGIVRQHCYRGKGSVTIEGKKAVGRIERIRGLRVTSSSQSLQALTTFAEVNPTEYTYILRSHPDLPELCQQAALLVSVATGRRTPSSLLSTPVDHSQPTYSQLAHH